MEQRLPNGYSESTSTLIRLIAPLLTLQNSILCKTCTHRRHSCGIAIFCKAVLSLARGQISKRLFTNNLWTSTMSTSWKWNWTHSQLRKLVQSQPMSKNSRQSCLNLDWMHPTIRTQDSNLNAVWAGKFWLLWNSRSVQHWRIWSKRRMIFMIHFTGKPIRRLLINLIKWSWVKLLHPTASQTVLATTLGKRTQYVITAARKATSGLIAFPTNVSPANRRHLAKVKARQSWTWFNSSLTSRNRSSNWVVQKTEPGAPQHEASLRWILASERTNWNRW